MEPASAVRVFADLPHKEQQSLVSEWMTVFLSLDEQDQARFIGACEAAAEGDEVSERFAVSDEELERGERRLRRLPRDLQHELWHLGPMPQAPRLTRTRPRERRGSRGHRRSSTTARDDGSDSDGPGDAGPPRRRFVVDDHYLVVAVLA